ncbi:MAG: glycosyltransferase family 4 protein [Burkholderiaceae bacterium]
MSRRVLVLGAQVPFARGGAENLNAGLVKAIADFVPDVEVDLVQLPFKHRPEQQLLADMMNWRLIDITEVDGRKVDLVIATKFPTYAVRHPNKVLWLVHQYRQAYELAGTIYDVPALSEVEAAARKKLRELDTRFIGECVARFAISETVSERLLRFNDLLSIPLWPPSLLQDRIQAGTYGESILYFGRLDRVKRVGLLVDAASRVPEVRVVICGAGPDRPALQTQIDGLGLHDRVRLAGHLPESALIDEIARARAVFYGPFDEDYGYATIEAFLAEKPVITCSDSGEAARMVERTGAGWVVDATPAAIADAIIKVFSTDDPTLRALGAGGAAFARGLSWRNIVDTMVNPHL